MSFEKVDKASWQALFDRVSKGLSGEQVQTEVVGLDLGDQIEEDWLTLDGISYDPNDDALYVSAHGATAERHLEHAILSPQEVYIERSEEGLTRVVTIDADRREQFVQLRRPLKLPADAG